MAIIKYGSTKEQNLPGSATVMEEPVKPLGQNCFLTVIYVDPETPLAKVLSEVEGKTGQEADIVSLKGDVSGEINCSVGEFGITIEPAQVIHLRPSKSTRPS